MNKSWEDGLALESPTDILQYSTRVPSRGLRRHADHEMQSAMFSDTGGLTFWRSHPKVEDRKDMTSNSEKEEFVESNPSSSSPPVRMPFQSSQLVLELTRLLFRTPLSTDDILLLPLVLVPYLFCYFFTISYYLLAASAPRMGR